MQDFVWLTTRTEGPHGAYVRGARRHRIDRHGGGIERLAGAKGAAKKIGQPNAFKQMVLGMAQGAIVDLAFGGLGSHGEGTNPTEGCGSLVKKNTEMLSKVEVSFSYQTSPHPDKAGPANDAFLVPSVYFEVIQTWSVAFQPDRCEIVGQMDVALQPNTDLSGFAFTTANDVETRVLPLLKDQKDEFDLILACDTQQSRVACCPAGADGEPVAGCKAETMSEYCDYSVGPDRTTALWQTCVGKADRVFKGNCKAKGAGHCSRGDNQADNIEQYCGGDQACLTFDDPTPIINAHNDWYYTLGRNYKHHEKARKMKTGEKDVLVMYDDIIPSTPLDDKMNTLRLKLSDHADRAATAIFDVVVSDATGAGTTQMDTLLALKTGAYDEAETLALEIEDKLLVAAYNAKAAAEAFMGQEDYSVDVELPGWTAPVIEVDSAAEQALLEKIQEMNPNPNPPQGEFQSRPAAP